MKPNLEEIAKLERKYEEDLYALYEQRLHDAHEKMESEIQKRVQEAYDLGYAEGKADAEKADAESDVDSTALERMYKNGYTVGSESAWKCARKIITATDEGGYSPDELTSIFGNKLVSHIFKLPVYDVLLRCQMYDRRKEEQLAEGEITPESASEENPESASDADLDCSAFLKHTLNSTLEQGDRETVNRESVIRALSVSSVPTWVVSTVRHEFEKLSNLQKDNEELVDLVKALKKTIACLCS